TSDNLTLTAPDGSVGTSATQPLNASLATPVFFTGIETSGSPVVGVTSTQGLSVGDSVSGTGIPSGTHIQSVNSVAVKVFSGSGENFFSFDVPNLAVGEIVTGVGIQPGTTITKILLSPDDEFSLSQPVTASFSDTETLTATGITLSQNA